MIYIRGDIPSKILDKHELPHNIESILLNWTLGKLNGYFLELTTPPPIHKMISTIWKRLTKILILVAATIKLF